MNIHQYLNTILNVLQAEIISDQLNYLVIFIPLQ